MYQLQNFTQNYDFFKENKLILFGSTGKYKKVIICYSLVFRRISGKSNLSMTLVKLFWLIPIRLSQNEPLNTKI